MDTKSYTTADVANFCRVSDATVKRWECAGLIKSDRTSGGHRRFRAEEIARFQNVQGLGERQKLGEESLTRLGAKRHADKGLSDCDFFHSLLSGSEEKASSILIERILEGERLQDLMDSLITNTMHHIGELWYQGKISISQEHIASRTISTALHNLRTSLPVPEPKDKLAICFAFEDELHELSIDCAQLALESVGWEVWNFGANMPLYSVSGEFDHHSPDMVCISSTTMRDIDRCTRDYLSFREKLSRHNAIVVIGGQTFEGDSLSDRFPADHYLKDFSSVVEIAIG